MPFCDRDAAVELHLHEPRCRFVGDGLEMTRFAADHRAERDQRVVLFRVGKFLQGERRFERAGTLTTVRAVTRNSRAACGRLRALRRRCAR